MPVRFTPKSTRLESSILQNSSIVEKWGEVLLFVVKHLHSLLMHLVSISFSNYQTFVFVYNNHQANVSVELQTELRKSGSLGRFSMHVAC